MPNLARTQADSVLPMNVSDFRNMFLASNLETLEGDAVENLSQIIHKPVKQLG